LDFIVELVGAKRGAPYLFAQVKATKLGCKTVGGERRLRVGLKKADALRMKAYPAPTYLVGVDEVEEKSYILSIDERVKSAVPEMPARHELNNTNLRVLWEEVDAYWRARDMRVKGSAFSL